MKCEENRIPVRAASICRAERTLTTLTYISPPAESGGRLTLADRPGGGGGREGLAGLLAWHVDALDLHGTGALKGLDTLKEKVCLLTALS